MIYLQAKNLTKIYKQNNDRIEGIEQASAEFSSGNITTLLGPNGSGKSTFIKMLCSEIRPDKGDIFYFSQSLNSSQNKREYVDSKRTVGYAPENPFLYSRLRGNEFLEFMASIYWFDLKEGNLTLKYLLEGFSMDCHLDKLIIDYSQGMIRKLSLIMALLFGQRIIILDEPTNGLDPTSYLFLLDVLKKYRKENRCIVLSTHQLDMAQELSDKLVLISSGHIIYNGEASKIKNMKEFYMNKMGI